MKRILFVDDELPILEGLRARLHKLHTKWSMMFVDSGAAAVERMQESPYDVIVSDMRMPGMDGARLLEIVSGRWPQTIRVVLSGYAELQQTIRLVPFAHQYLSKPCQPQQLENVIDRCLLLHDLLNQPGLRSLVGRIRALPTLPRIYTALQGIVKDDNVTLADVAKLVAADSALAARVLQIVNSSFFRLARRISNIEQAVSYLGFQSIRNLAMSVEIFSRWAGRKSAAPDLEKLQQHVHAVAAAANCIATKTPISDDTLLAGLLHDIGYWVLAQECPEELTRAMQLAGAEAIPMHVAETRIIGASHAEIGAYLLGIWGLPYPVVEAVAHHHQPERVTQTEFDVLAALVIGHSLAATDDASVFGAGVPPDPKVDARYVRAVKAPIDWEEATRRVAATTEAEEMDA
ncbi:MAG: HDOD domain-containing protein [Acetobacteraceae bacterium]|nr:HDOD domain-containing protein [Acetobacteraceae bacterium]